MPLRRPRSGFTLIEIMVVVAIIGLLLGLVSMKVIGQQAAASRTTTKARMSRIQTALGLYKLDMKKYPSGEEGLKALTTPPKNRSEGYLDDADLLDAWGTAIQYSVPGPNGKSFDLISFGDDKAAGGENEDSDFSCWETDAP